MLHIPLTQAHWSFHHCLNFYNWHLDKHVCQGLIKIQDESMIIYTILQIHISSI